MTDTRDNGGPVFPHLNSQMDPGMSLRDWFAGQALVGDSANSEGGIWANDHPLEGLLRRAQLYYRIADAMLEARK